MPFRIHQTQTYRLENSHAQAFVVTHLFTDVDILWIFIRLHHKQFYHIRRHWFDTQASLIYTSLATIYHRDRRVRWAATKTIITTKNGTKLDGSAKSINWPLFVVPAPYQVRDKLQQESISASGFPLAREWQDRRLDSWYIIAIKFRSWIVGLRKWKEITDQVTTIYSRS